MNDLVVAAYGGGTNSTALLIECAEREIKIDLILFADTGGEKPHTYKYVDMFSKWLVDHGLPEIIIVKSHLPPLDENCLINKELPAIAYGFKSCSDKWKIRPVDKYLQSVRGDDAVLKMIGIDADEQHRSIEAKAKWYTNRFPLIEWDMGRDECIESIEAADLPLPGKSACYFCPSSRPSEVKELAHQYPELAARALLIESTAELTSIKGLGRNWAWADLLATDDMFEDDYGTAPDMACGCYDG